MPPPPALKSSVLIFHMLPFFKQLRGSPAMMFGLGRNFRYQPITNVSVGTIQIDMAMAVSICFPNLSTSHQVATSASGWDSIDGR